MATKGYTSKRLTAEEQVVLGQTKQLLNAGAGV